MLKQLFESAAGVVFFLFFLVVYFPGGTIIMALSCNSQELDGWDWVLSVIIPAFGLFTALFSSAC